MGIVALAIGMLLALVAAGLEASMRPGATRAAVRAHRGILVLSALALTTATTRLGLALIRNEFSFTYVASTSRRGAPLPVRLSGLWGGAEGSLLLFTALLAIAIAAVPEPVHRSVRSMATFVVAALSAATLFAASPFERLPLPPLSGRGVAPILEHPAMLAHPPLLYVGTVLALLPALCANHRRARHLAIASFTTITVALLLGSMWAYVELGWGGWWAWDPVENVALLPWLLFVATFHAASSSRSTTLTYALLWPLILAGTAMTRTSLRTSVHAFADAAALRWWLWPTTAAAALAMALFTATRVRGQRPPRRRDARAISRLLVWSSVAVIALGTFRPFVPGDATAGWFYTTMLFPATVVGSIGCGLLPNLGRTARRKLAAATVVGSVSGLVLAWLGDAHAWNQLVLAAAIGAGCCLLAAGRTTRVSTVLGHAGMLCVVAGALAGTTGTSETVVLAAGTTVEVAGHSIQNVSVTATERAPVPEIRAVLLVDETTRAEPSIAIYADRALRLPEVATVSTFAADVQVVLRSADDDQTVTVTINVQPLIRLVWLGALLLIACGVTMAVERRYPFSRFDRSSSSTVDSGVDGSEASGFAGFGGGSGGGAVGRVDPAARFAALEPVDLVGGAAAGDESDGDAAEDAALPERSNQRGR